MFPILAVFLLVVSCAVALPAKACLSDRDAEIIASQWASLNSNFSATLAQSVIAPNYYDQSDSANTILNNDNATSLSLSLGAPTFTSKASYISIAAHQPFLPIKILNTWHTCKAVTVRFVFLLTPLQTQGISVIEAVQETASDGSCNPAAGGWQIKTVYGEFNTVAFLRDIGVTCGK